jgi:CheY-like chemotaxis protein
VKKVLILDDSNVVRQVVKIYLAGHDYEVLEAEDAERALQLCRLTNPDIVISDINLPGMSGIEFVTQLRADPSPRLRGLPVVLLTGDKNDSLRADGLRAGANAFVKKPVVGPALREALAEVLKKAGP